MKKLILALGIVSLVFISSPARADDTGWKVTNFTDQITVQSSGKVQIQETINVDFGSLQKHGIYRDIPYRYQVDNGSTINTDIEQVSVTDGLKSVPYSTSNTDSYLELKIGDANKTVSGAQTYVISYLVTGVLRNFDNIDELYWNVTGNDWTVPIEKASATVTLPTGVIISQSSCYQGASGSNETCTANNNGQFATTRSLDPAEGFTIAAGYPKGAVPLLTGSGKVPGSLANISFPQLFFGFLLALILGLGFLIYKWWKTGRDDNDAPSYKQTVIAEYEPPAKLRPGEIGVLMDERADAIDLSASIVDLAVRGYLTITEIPKKGLFSSIDYKLDRTKKTDTDLMEWEKKLLSSIFESGLSVQISKLKSTSLALNLKQVKDLLYKDVTAKELFSNNPEEIRNTYTIEGILILFLSLMATAFSFETMPSFIPGFLAGLTLVGLLTIIFAFVMPKRTAKGKELLRQAKGYKLFLITTDKDRLPYFEKQGMFMQALPYAMVFGVTSQLAKVMKELNIQPTQPNWYYGSGPFVPMVFANNMNTFSNSLSSAFAPVSSSSGSGGGGFSGGGFGGGGGGSW